MTSDRITVTIDVHVNLSFWQALKLRLAGASYVQGYIEHLLETTIRRSSEDTIEG